MEHNFAQAFSKILFEKGYIGSEDYKSITRDFKTRSKESLVYFLLDEGLVPKEDLLDALSFYFKVPSFDVVGYFFEHDLVASFPSEFLTSNGIIPLSLEQGILTVVASQPDQAGLSARIGEYTEANVEFLVGIKRDIWDAIQEFTDESLTAEDFEKEVDEGEDESIVDEDSL